MPDSLLVELDIAVCAVTVLNYQSVACVCLTTMQLFITAHQSNNTGATDLQCAASAFSLITVNSLVDTENLKKKRKRKTVCLHCSMFIHQSSLRSHSTKMDTFICFLKATYTQSIYTATNLTRTTVEPVSSFIQTFTLRKLLPMCAMNTVYFHNIRS